MDFICKDKCVKKRELSFFVNPKEKLFYLNNEKDTWNHPCDINEKYDYSFTELYIKAINKAANIINDIDKMLLNKKIDNTLLEKILGNLNYGTGKDCDINFEYKYYRF